MSLLKIENLSFAYERELVLENINLEVKKNDFLAIIGPNGGGKSTLLKLILGIYHPQKGSLSKSTTQLSYVPQNTNINTHFPIQVLEVVLMGYRGSTSTLFRQNKEAIASAKQALKTVGMEHFSHHKIGSLSGGQRQRVMIARALCSQPQILILDEPTSSIDIKGQKEIYQLLQELNKEITIIVVSHDISIILEYANTVAHLNKILSYHDISNKKETFHTHQQDEHFCEIELLQMLGANDCNSCKEESQ